jgi:E3 ubiquitin-protein ligase synoviolin
MPSFTAYSTVSTAFLGAMIYSAYEHRRQFYPTVIHLMSSKLSLLVLGNEALVLTLLFGQLCKRLFFGRLRDAEVESLYDRSWYAITETCLAMTIFREEFNFRFVAMFTALLFLKIFHWLMQDRVAYMEQSPAVSYLTHGRMLVLMALLFTLDCAFLHHAVGTSLRRGPSVLLLFAFEYLILASTVCATFSKYALHCNDMRMGGRWDDKGVYLFYLELVTDLFHMLVYLAFFVLICTYYGLPLHIMRDLYLTIRSFRQRVADFVRYRRITHNMHDRFPDATPEDLERADYICIVCRDHV